MSRLVSEKYTRKKKTLPALKRKKSTKVWRLNQADVPVLRRQGIISSAPSLVSVEQASVKEPQDPLPLMNLRIDRVDWWVGRKGFYKWGRGF